MHNKLRTLYNLQQTDTRLVQIEHSKEGLPQLVNEIQNAITNENNSIISYNNSIDSLREHLMTVERKIDQSKDVLDNSKERRNHVTNNREYEALINEIAFHEKQLADSGDQKILLQKEIEKNLAAIENSKVIIKELDGKLDISKQQLTAKLSETEKEELDLKELRNKFISELPAQLIKLYERIFKAKHSLAVAQSDDGSCSGCHTKLPSQKLSELKRYDSLVHCDVCSRILTLGFSKETPKDK